VGDLKPGWKRVKFGDVVRLNNDKSKDPEADGLEHFVGLEHIEPGELRVRSWGDVSEGTTFTNRFGPGQVLFGKRRAYQRKVAVADFEGVCSGDIYVLEPKDPTMLLTGLLPFICQTDAFFAHAVGTSAGSLSPRTNWKSLADYEFSLPPLDEQARMLELLAASDNVTQGLHHSLKAAQAARLSTRDTLTALPDETHRPLGGLCEMQNGRPFPSKQYQDVGIRLLRAGNLGSSGRMTWPVEKTVCLPSDWMEDAKEHVIRTGDVCINLTAQSLEDGFMGRVVMAETGDECLLNQRIGRFTGIHNNVRPAWLFRVLQSTRFLRYAASRCEGTKVQHLFWSHLEDFDIPLPSLADQDARLRVLQEMDDAVSAIRSRLSDHRTAHHALREALVTPAAHAGLTNGVH
jgi:type I restriction enzyme S subunit